MLDVNQRHQKTVTQKAWREKWSLGGKTQVHYERAIEGQLLPLLGDTILVALTFEDCLACVEEVEADSARLRPQGGYCPEDCASFWTKAGMANDSAATILTAGTTASGRYRRGRSWRPRSS